MDQNQSNDRAKEIQELYRFVAKQVTAGLFKSEILEKLIELGVERLLALDLLAEMERRLTNLRKRVILLAMSAGEAREAIRKEFWIFGYEVVLVDALPVLSGKLEARVPDLVIADAFDQGMK
ncbi:MAG TPA: hypothetical protein VLJ10_05585, partial [Candidatus Bathyarchaeia archaeon]|nr:hypothetical protein [Candidatus Bathyarchaeia archaeon]